MKLSATVKEAVADAESELRKKKPPKRVPTSVSGERTDKHAIRESVQVVLLGAAPRVQSHAGASISDSPRTTWVCRRSNAGHQDSSPLGHYTRVILGAAVKFCYERNQRRARVWSVGQCARGLRPEWSSWRSTREHQGSAEANSSPACSCRRAPRRRSACSSGITTWSCVGESRGCRRGLRRLPEGLRRHPVPALEGAMKRRRL
jgi:hypothetical protein